MFTMVNAFANWVNEQLDDRKWSQAELARKAGISRATISKLLSYNEDQMPTAETLVSIARALRFPPEYVFRKAGILPVEPDDDPSLAEANQLLSELPEEYRKQALQLLRFLHDTHVPYAPESAHKTT